MSDSRLKAILVAVATLAFGLSPLIVPPFRGYDPAQFPVIIPRPAIQPAGYAFSIWGVIYLWLFLSAGYGLLRRATDPAWDRARAPLILALVLGAVWLAIAAVAPIVATVVIAVMAAAAVTAFLRSPPDQDRWLLAAPLAMFAGWLSAAAAVSLGVVLAGYGVVTDGAGALAMLVLVLAVAITVQRLRPAMPVYGLTVVWALVALVVVNASDARPVAIAAGLGALAMLVTVLRR